MTHEQLEKVAWDRLNALLDEYIQFHRAKKSLEGELLTRINLVATALTLLRRGQSPATTITLWVVGMGMARAYWTGQWHHDTAGSRTKARRNRAPYRVPVYRAIDGQMLQDGTQIEWLPKQAGGGA